jgi:dienelactone hydrolase
MRTLINWLTGVVLTASMMPALAGNPVFDPGQKGPYAVGFATDTLTDYSRGVPGVGRPIPVYVWYPVDPADIDGAAPAVYPMDPLYDLVPAKSSEEFEAYGLDAAYDAPPVSSKKPFPLVIFSPGAFNAAWYDISMPTRLASHGFVVAVLYHAGDGVWAPYEPRIRLENAAWHRPRDISFALDMLLEANGMSDHLLSGAIRPDKVAAAGYSLGGYAAMVLGGAGEDDICPHMAHWYPDPPNPKFCTATAPDPRIKAIVAFDGAAYLLDWEELARIRVPTMIIGEEWNMLAAFDQYGEGGEHARTHAAIQGHPSYRVDVFGTNHASFRDSCAVDSLIHDDEDLSPFKPQIDDEWLEGVCDSDGWMTTPSTVAMPIVNKYTVAFLKTVLAGEPGYQDMLTPGWALEQSLVEFFVTEKRNPKAVRDDPGFGEYFLYFPHQPGSEQARGKKDPSAKSVLWRGFSPH